MSLYSMVRVWRVNTNGLMWSEQHARRTTVKAQSRVVRDEPPVTYVPEGVSIDPCSYAELYASHVEGAFVPKAKAKALHMLMKFPDSVPVATRQDAEVVLHLAVDFGRRVFGENAVFAARMDRDETSQTNVDLFITPRYVKKTKLTEKVAVSLTRDLKALAEQYGPLPTNANGLREQGAALQDEFAKFLRERGYQAIRGQKKITVGPDWTSPEAYAARTDRKIADATLAVAKEHYEEATAERDAAAADRDVVDASVEALDRHWTDVIDEHRRLAQLQDADSRRRQSMNDAAVDCARHIAEEAERAAAERIARAEEKAKQIEEEAMEAAAARSSSISALEAAAAAASMNAASDREQAKEQRIAAERANSEAAQREQEAMSLFEAARRHEEVISNELTIVAADRKQVAGEREASDLTVAQLALIDRASRDDRLALVIDDASPRGVSMDESVMVAEEQKAYRAPWSEVARLIARTVALTLRRAKELVDAARQRADTILSTARARVSEDRAALAAKNAELAAQQSQLRTDKSIVDREKEQAKAFADAWRRISPDRRSPPINNLVQLAEELSRDPRASLSVTPKGQPSGDRPTSIETGENER